jgi:hypothetical protein
MDTNWKDYQGNDETFWEHEWGKHGTCISTLDTTCYNNYQPQAEVVDYFEKAVELNKGLNSYKVSRNLRRNVLVLNTVADSRRRWHYPICHFHLHACPDPERTQGCPRIHPNIGMQERRSPGDLVPLQRSRQCSNRPIRPNSARYYPIFQQSPVPIHSQTLTRLQMEPSPPALPQVSSTSSSTPLAEPLPLPALLPHQPQLELLVPSPARVSSRPTPAELTRAA